jgi:hypothetical protein
MNLGHNRILTLTNEGCVVYQSQKISGPGFSMEPELDALKGVPTQNKQHQKTTNYVGPGFSPDS